MYEYLFKLRRGAACCALDFSPRRSKNKMQFLSFNLEQDLGAASGFSPIGAILNPRRSAPTDNE
jgi:hypothetical protein